MKRLDAQPSIEVGLMTAVQEAAVELKGDFRAPDGSLYAAGSYRFAEAIDLVPFDLVSASFLVHDVLIGIDFHWERRQDQEFRGSLHLRPDPAGRLTVINKVPVESYLESVISSEMSEHSHPELLKAHAIISRSWLLAQIAPWRKSPAGANRIQPDARASGELIRWYDRENHAGFDVCADDHCQRYQGITRAVSNNAADAVRSTRGMVLISDDQLCDARFSKSCGGMTEGFSAAWADDDFSYLQVAYDGESFPEGYSLPLTREEHAERWIRNAPPAFCNTADPGILGRILPDFDQETRDFYRWRITLGQEELQNLLRRKVGVDLGFIRQLRPLERGGSGRIIRLRIEGDRGSLVLGKELEIRRALSASHLYSSAFVIDSAPDGSSFALTGAGWGHGVGLCQIGAALMAEKGYAFQSILEHYYRGSLLFGLYE